MIDFDALVHDTLADILGETVEYQPEFGIPLTVQALVVEGDQVYDGLGRTRLQGDGVTVEIRKAVLPGITPGPGDRVIMDRGDYQVKVGRDADADGLVWRIDMVPV